MLEGVDLFDAGFFGYSPREADLLDPQHRLFLECAWEALEHAGYDPKRYAGLIGVYAGASTNGYLGNIFSNPELWSRPSACCRPRWAARATICRRACRTSLNLRGPSLNVQTACSTSLVAVHQACRSLVDGECDMALAGGVSMSLGISRRAGYLYAEEGILSPDGHCRAFDAQAHGTVWGDGVGVVVLKRLADALADGDVVHARDPGHRDQQRRFGESRLYRPERRRAGRRRSRARRPLPVSIPRRSATSRRTAPARRSAIRSRSRR